MIHSASMTQIGLCRAANNLPSCLHLNFCLNLQGGNRYLMIQCQAQVTIQYLHVYFIIHIKRSYVFQHKCLKVIDTVKYDTLTHWGRVTHVCVVKQTIIGSDNGLSPERRKAIIWTNAGILLIGPLGINFSEILIGIQTFSFKKMHLKMSSAKWRPFGLGLNVLILRVQGIIYR